MNINELTDPPQWTRVLPREGYWSVAARFGYHEPERSWVALAFGNANGWLDLHDGQYLMVPPGLPPLVEQIAPNLPRADMRRIDRWQAIGMGSDFDDVDVIENVWFTREVERKDNIDREFRNCYFDAGVRAWGSFYGKWTFNNCEMGSPDFGIVADGIKGHTYAAHRCRVHNTSDGFGVFDTSHSGAEPFFVDVQVCDNEIGPLHYHHDLKDPPRPEGSHPDALQIQGGWGVEFTGNLSIMTKGPYSDTVPGDPNAGDEYNRHGGQGVMINRNVASVGDVLVADNRFGGGGTAVNVTSKDGPEWGPIVVRNNITHWDVPQINRWDMHLNGLTEDTTYGNVRQDGSPVEPPDRIYGMVAPDAFGEADRDHVQGVPL